MNQTDIVTDYDGKQEAEVSLVDVLIVLAKSKRLLLILPFGIALLAALFSLALPNKYTAKAVLLPPQKQQSGASALLLQLDSVAGATGGGMKNPNDVYVGMLNSRTIADKVIARFALAKLYEADTADATRAQLAARTEVKGGKDGLISVSYTDRDPQRAALVANGFVDELMGLNRTLAVTEAAQRRVFFEQQLEQAKNNLAKAEMALKQALDVRGVISVDAESLAIVETISGLRARISAKEIQIGAMRAFVTTENPEYRRAGEELSSLKSELSKLENGRPSGGAGNGPGAKTPVGLENIKILRDVKYQQMLYEILAKQYEMARLDESKDSSVLQVLDPAVAPDTKSSPRRVIMVILAAVAGLLLALAIIVLRNAKHLYFRGADAERKWALLQSHLGLGRPAKT